MATLQLPKYNPNLSLTEALKQASINPELLAVFYLRLLKEDIYVIVGTPNTEEFYTSDFNSNVSIMQLKNGSIPVFTASNRIYDSGVITKEVTYMKVKGRSFLELILGCSISINPFSEYHLTLNTSLIASLLDTSFFSLNKEPKSIYNQEITSISIKDKPLNLLIQVKNYFESIPKIKQAYIAKLLDKRIEKKPHFIIALDCEEMTKREFTTIVNQLSQLCLETLRNEQFIEVIPLKETNKYFSFFKTHTQPFYINK
ncbi:MAG: enhanced serine sensitivity protein SseB [Flavobacteriaceae bacterium]|jgi:hypothetical protein|nr:enhanced serine sensitivity protein SseB [Flavobacteriaceae bacterium]